MTGSSFTPEGRRALAAWRQMRRFLAFTYAKRRALQSLLERHRSSRMLIFTADNDTAYAIAVVVNVQRPLPTVRAERRPIPVRIADAPLVRRPVRDVLGDDRAAFLTGRPPPNKASFTMGRRNESIVAHEALHCCGSR